MVFRMDWQNMRIGMGRKYLMPATWNLDKTLMHQNLILLLVGSHGEVSRYVITVVIIVF